LATPQVASNKEHKEIEVRAFRDSVERIGIHTDAVRLVGISAGIPDRTADREVQSLIGGIAYRLHGIEDSRLEESLLGCTTIEYGDAIVKSVIYYSICYSGMVLGDPAAGKTC
jgi:hypothetical protein